MAHQWKILRGSAVLSLNEAISNGCSFIRNFILARVLSKDDFGVAVTLTVTFLFLEMTSKMAFGQQVIISKNGGDRKFVDTSHAVQLAVGLCSALAFVLLAKPLSVLLTVPHLAGGLMLLSLVPLFMALVNLGAFTYARELHFERSASLEAVPQILITLAAWPVAVWLRDFRAFIWLQIGKAFLTMLVSYGVGGRRYAWAFRKDYIVEIFRFSWPLMLSGFIMTCSSQGDRLVMTQAFTLQDIASYGAAFTLTAAPSIALLKIVGGTALPLMAQAANDLPLMKWRYGLVAQVFSLAGVLFAICMVIGGTQVMTLLFGHKYSDAGVIGGWLACVQAVRMARGAPTGVGWGRGETRSQMLGNVVRLIGLALVVPVVIWKLPLNWVAIAALIGETLALTAMVLAVKRWHQVEAWICFRPVVLGAVCVGASAAAAHWFMPTTNLLLIGLAMGVACSLAVLIYARVFQEFRTELAKTWRTVETRLRRPPQPTPTDSPREPGNSPVVK